MMPTTLFFIEILKSKLNGPAYEVVKYSEFDTFDSLTELKKQFLQTKTFAQVPSELCK